MFYFDRRWFGDPRGFNCQRRTCTMVACRAQCHMRVGAMQEIVESSGDFNSQILGDLRSHSSLPTTLVHMTT
jgi:hypothetical protein